MASLRLYGASSSGYPRRHKKLTDVLRILYDEVAMGATVARIGREGPSLFFLLATYSFGYGSVVGARRAHLCERRQPVFDKCAVLRCQDASPNPGAPRLPARRRVSCAAVRCRPHSATSTISCQSLAAAGRRPFFIGYVIGSFTRYLARPSWQTGMQRSMLCLRMRT
jgi:hypothetical protein